jgi:hypothetical protein
MIVVHTEDELLRFIAQPAHAAGAGQLAARWRQPTALPEAIWPRLVEAVRRHDDGWRDLERQPAVDEQGRPHTFKTLPTQQHVALWRRGIDALAGEDAYAALLMALHARWLYTRIDRNDDPQGEAAAQQFMNWLDERIDALMQALQADGDIERAAIEPHALDLARRLVGFFDMLSLVLLGALPINDWPEPLPFGDRCQSLRLLMDSDGTMSVLPWPFVSDLITVTFDTRELTQTQFDSAEALGEALTQTPRVPVTCTLRISE